MGKWGWTKALVKGIFKEIKETFSFERLFTIIFILAASYFLTMFALKVVNGVFGGPFADAAQQVQESDEPFTSEEKAFFDGCIVGHISLLKDMGVSKEDIESNFTVLENACGRLMLDYYRDGLAESP